MTLAATLKLRPLSCSLRSHLSNQDQVVKTAGILVIGDEILKGDVKDVNSPLVTKQLHKLGVKVKKISVVGDVVDEISSEVKSFSSLYNYVITTGGIGPTHDDVTFEAVAKAFNVPLIRNPYLCKLCQNYYKTSNVSHPAMKHAMIPESAQLNYADSSNFPNISLKNVFMFPGVPELFRKSFCTLSPKLFPSAGVVFYCKSIYINITEDQICQILDDVVLRFSQVQFGSYPKLKDESYKVKITIESTDETTTNKALETLLKKLPQNSIVLTK